MVKIAIIGGTGVYDPRILANIRQEETATPYGLVEYKVGEYAGKEVAFIPRHGSNHSITPHLINYRANIWAMKKIGVQDIIATTAVGSMNLDMKPGDFVLIDQFIDFTKNRHTTFYEGGRTGRCSCRCDQSVLPDPARCSSKGSQAIRDRYSPCGNICLHRRTKI